MSACKGELHLIPVTLGDDDGARIVLPESTLSAIAALDYFIVENEKTARRFLKNAAHPRSVQQLKIERFNKNDGIERAIQLLLPVGDGRSAGLLSEAGCPAIADPGSLLVEVAHRNSLRVVPHVGPASLVLALMASGFNGQQFVFHGYLPVPRELCRNEIRVIEQASRSHDASQLFIETPYRNDVLLQTLIETCQMNTRLCVASDLTLMTETVRSMRISEWKKLPPLLGRRPSVFILYAR